MSPYNLLELLLELASGPVIIVGGKHSKNGEGLGLSITWGRPGVDAMQRAMWVESI